ncbi:MAG: hypothetical protein DI626_02655 [Micavibrio aeruginosavorus]|uniref:Uncharacterized protein n=1 Tax=Micavibrio aeruginosavorus TaxID=349221 RepID=A0A2W5C1Z9_9BACT|nr:MAG: hypothetical protein DI626_02655 [Micavibrio aeruginosavorus]
MSMRLFLLATCSIAVVSAAFPAAAQDTVVAVPETAPAQTTAVAPVEEPVVSVIDSDEMPPPMTASEQTVPPDPAVLEQNAEQPVVQDPATAVPVTPETQAQQPAGNPETAPATQADAPANADGSATPPADGTQTPAQAAPLEGIANMLSMQNWSTPVEKEMAEQLNYAKPVVDMATMPSLFLTIPESDLILDARLGLNTRPVDDPGAPVANLPPGATELPTSALSVDAPREIKLSGLLYKSKSDWIIWLNGKQITPKSLPTEIYDIKVYKNYIELEWFDGNTNQIFPIRLRPHQRFNLDARMFLPG